MKNKLIVIALIFFALQGCLKDDLKNTNQDIFQFIWDEMDQHYGGFIPRHVNWDSLYLVYQPQAALTASEEELWQVCIGLLDVLDDQHIYLYSANRDIGFASGKEFDEEIAEKEFEIENIKNNYIHDFTSIITNDEEFIYGKIVNENIGYIYIPNFVYNESEWYKKIDDAIAFLQNTDALILDLRNNGGGSPLLDRYMASRFVAEEKLVFSIQTRNGPDHNDFDEPTPYYAKPQGNLQYTKPTMALANHSTVSAGEEFLLLLETQNHITVVGDSTSNAFSSVAFTRLLPNGWEFGLPNQLYTYPDGSSPEGTGIIPDVYIRNDTIDVRNGMDKVLEMAIDMSQSSNFSF